MLRAAILFSVLAASGAGCATARPVVTVESVGELAPSYHSIATAPVHATTDLSPDGFVSGGDDDGATTGPAPAATETPDVAPKSGLTMGAVR